MSLIDTLPYVCEFLTLHEAQELRLVSKSMIERVRECPWSDDWSRVSPTQAVAACIPQAVRLFLWPMKAEGEYDCTGWPNLRHLSWLHHDMELLLPLLGQLTGLRIRWNPDVNDETWDMLFQHATQLDALTLSYFRLEDPVLPATLQTLKLSNCSLEGQLPALPLLKDLTADKGLTDAALRPLTSLTRLNARVARAVTDDGLRGLTRLQSLSLWGHTPGSVTVEDLRGLTRIGDSFSALTGLHSLEISDTSVYALNCALEYLPRLTRLVALVPRPDSAYAAHPSLALRTELQQLHIGTQDGPGRGELVITDAQLVPLTGLRDLALWRTGHLETGRVFSNMRHLTKLDVRHCTRLVDAAFVSLTNLRSLHVTDCTMLTDAALAPLTGLLSLSLHVPPIASEWHRAPFTGEAIAGLTSLRSLKARDVFDRPLFS